MYRPISRPSHMAGARNQQWAFPHLWRGCVGAWCPSLQGPIDTTTLLDWSGAQRNGTFVNSPTWSFSTGQYALNFSGTAQITIAANSVFQLANALTLNCWVNSSNTANAVHLAMSAWTTNNYWLGQLNNTAFSFFVGSASLSVSLSTVHDGFWHMVTAVADTGSSGTIQKAIIYVDGKPAASTSYTGGSSTASQTLYLGAQSGGNTYQGLMDDWSVHNRAYSPGEVAQRYALGRAGWYGQQRRRMFQVPSTSGSSRLLNLRRKLVAG